MKSRPGEGPLENKIPLFVFFDVNPGDKRGWPLLPFLMSSRAEAAEAEGPTRSDSVPRCPHASSSFMVPEKLLSIYRRNLASFGIFDALSDSFASPQDAVAEWVCFCEIAGRFMVLKKIVEHPSREFGFVWFVWCAIESSADPQMRTRMGLFLRFLIGAAAGRHALPIGRIASRWSFAMLRTTARARLAVESLRVDPSASAACARDDIGEKASGPEEGRQ